jgi:amino acid adenylation domain-containing protein
VTPAVLLAHLNALDVRLAIENGRLRINAPKGAITEELSAALRAHKDALVRMLEGVDDAAASAVSLVPVPREEALPLSFVQERIWMLTQLQPGLTAYNLATLFTPGERVDPQLLGWAVRRTIQRHEILRSRFVFEGTSPVVKLAAPEATVVDVVDLRPLGAEERRRVLDTAAAEATRRPFDLAAEAPVRFGIFRTGEMAAALLISAHHIALDAWSFVQLARTIRDEYFAVLDEQPVAPPPAVQYLDFAIWQRRRMDQPDAQARLAYWRRQLEGLPQLSVFPGDHATDADGSGRGAAYDFVWPVELYESVRSLARDCDATVYMVLTAAMTALLHRHTGQTDIAIGSPLGTRELAELEGVIGPMLNPIVLRLDLSDKPTFPQLVARVRETLLEGHANQDVPFEQVVREVNPSRSLRYSPLFQVAVVLHNAPEVSEVPLTGGGALYDLSLFATERGTLRGSFEYRADVYEASTIARISAQLATLLEAAARDRTLTVSELPLIDAAERRLVLETFNDTACELDRSVLVDQFRRIALDRPERVAVVAPDRSLTYGELDRLSDALAARLRTSGVGRSSIVALATERSSALPVAALAILKSGGAYLPIDLAFPAERIAFMLRDSGARHAVTTRGLASSLTFADDTTVLLVEDAVAVSPADADPVAHTDGPQAGDLAYLMYTSGSTGTPKGVMVPHGTVSNFLGAMHRSIGFAADDSVLAVTSPSFDISVLELFLPLVRGGRLIVADRETVTDGTRLAQLIASSGATMLQQTPSGWRLLMNAGWEGDPRLTAIVGGEALPPSLAEWLRSRVKVLWNAYGPTETTVWSMLSKITDDGSITIGKPIANTRVYVLDGAGYPVPIGAPGEVCIAGDGVARGYHGQPELTAHVFVPELGRPDAVMYRTGDIGRWRADGRLEYLGREDGQVKVRGYRIETGEIEAALAAHEAVGTAVVGVRAAAADDPRLVAWVQLHPDFECTGSELRRFLRQRLPDYMIPAMITIVETLPVTPNGKIDRRALPDGFASGAPLRGDRVPPTTPTERVIADIWSQLLEVKELSVTDGFFELGGHSLLAMRAAQEIAARTGVRIESRLLFFRTLEQLAALCDAQSGSAEVTRS